MKVYLSAYHRSAVVFDHVFAKVTEKKLEQTDTQVEKLLESLFTEINIQSAYFFSKQIKLLVSDPNKPKAENSMPNIISPEQSPRNQENEISKTLKKTESQSSLSTETSPCVSPKSSSKEESSEAPETPRLKTQLSQKSFLPFQMIRRKSFTSKKKERLSQSDLELSEDTKQTIASIVDAEELSDFSSSIMEEDDLCFDVDPKNPNRPIIKYGTLPRLINCLIVESNQNFVPGR